MNKSVDSTNGTDQTRNETCEKLKKMSACFRKWMKSFNKLENKKELMTEISKRAMGLE